MRITSETIVSSTLRRLSTRMERVAHVQSQLATGKRMLAPSEDPAAAGRGLALRATLRGREQNARGASEAREWLNITDSRLQTSMERLRRARDLAVRGATVLTGGEGQALAHEVRAIRDELVAVANSRHRGRPVFSGFSDQDPVTKDANGQWAYAGDNGDVTRSIGERDAVTINVTAAAAFGLDDPANSLFADLDRLAEALDSGDSTAVSGLIGNLDVAQRRLGGSLARVGGVGSRVDAAVNRLAESKLALRGQLAETEDVDLAEAVMELQTQEVAYEATLQALSRSLPQSLVNFLR